MSLHDELPLVSSSSSSPSSSSGHGERPQRPQRRRRTALRLRVLLSLLVVVFGAAARSDKTVDAGGKTSSPSPSTNRTTKHIYSMLLRQRRETGLRSDGEEEEDCVAPAVDEFPGGFMSTEQREKGGILVHFLIACYLILVLGVVCDDYFVPVLEVICERLKLTPDVAGATFMAAGTSSPEFFTNVISTFIAESDLGIGTIVGSAVFNIFGVIAVCGLFAGKKIPLDWYPVTRDCLIYGVTVIILFAVLNDEKVFWYEAMLMVLSYCLYILVIFFNPQIERWSHNIQKKIRTKVFPEQPTESTPLHHQRQRQQGSGAIGSSSNNNGTAVTVAVLQPPPVSSKGVQVATGSVPLATSESLSDIGSSESSIRDVINGPVGESGAANSGGGNNVAYDNGDGGSGGGGGRGRGDEDEADGDEFRYPWQTPDTRGGVRGCLEWTWWLLLFPAHMLFFLTIPDVRKGPRCARFFPLSFAMCMAWIGFISYLLTWMITVIGFTLSIPDSVMGLTFLAVGTSIPEVISSLIVSRQGKGSMAISNSIGSNTFDILLCLGIPWLIKAIMEGTTSGDKTEYLVEVQSEGLAYTVITLFVSLVMLYLILLAARFVLSRTLGFVSLAIYVVFLAISIMFETNVFFDVNLPMCDSSKYS